MTRLSKFLSHAALAFLLSTLPVTAHGAAQDQGTLLIKATDAAGEILEVHGVLRSRSGPSIELVSGETLTLDAGEYPLRLGVETQDGSLYRPLAQRAVISAGQETVLEVVVEKPPTVTARFVENGVEHQGVEGPYYEGRVSAYRNGQQIFHFNAGERVYIQEGEYSFHSTPNPDNEDLTVRTSFAAGEHKVITFEMVATVRAFIKMVAAGSGLDFRGNYELWQNDQRVKTIHWVHGVWTIPGTYDVRLPSRLTPYVHGGVKLEMDSENEFRIEVPVGHLEVLYQAADGTPMAAERVLMSRVTSPDAPAEDHNPVLKKSGEKIPLTAGRYRVEAWRDLGTFEPVEVDIEVGEDVEVVLREQG